MTKHGKGWIKHREYLRKINKYCFVFRRHNLGMFSKYHYKGFLLKEIHMNKYLTSCEYIVQLLLCIWFTFMDLLLF